jgi:type III secretion system FlhB-like substrate exporter
LLKYDNPSSSSSSFLFKKIFMVVVGAYTRVPSALFWSHSLYTLYVSYRIKCYLIKLKFSSKNVLTQLFILKVLVQCSTHRGIFDIAHQIIHSFKSSLITTSSNYKIQHTLNNHLVFIQIPPKFQFFIIIIIFFLNATFSQMSDLESQS